MTSAPTALRGTAQTWFLVACWTLFALIAIAGLVDGTGPESKAPLASIIILAPVLVGGAVLAVRTYRAEIRIEETGLLLRGMFRTRRLAWADVARARVQPTNELRLFWLLAVEKTDGSVVKVDGAANFGPRRDPAQLPVGRMAKAINERLAR